MDEILPRGNEMRPDHRKNTSSENPSQNQNKGSTLLSIKEAGEIIKLGPWCIRRLIYSGALPYVRIGRRLLIELDDLERFIAANRHQEGFRG